MDCASWWRKGSQSLTNTHSMSPPWSSYFHTLRKQQTPLENWGLLRMEEPAHLDQKQKNKPNHLHRTIETLRLEQTSKIIQPPTHQAILSATSTLPSLHFTSTLWTQALASYRDCLANVPVQRTGLQFLMRAQSWRLGNQGVWCLVPLQDQGNRKRNTPRFLLPFCCMDELRTCCWPRVSWNHLGVVDNEATGVYLQES